MGQFLDEVRNLQARNSDLRRALVVIGVVSIVGMYLVKQVPVNLSLNVSPSVRAGDVIKFKNGVAPVPAPNVYAFSFYVWQQVNRWSTDGRKDYGQQIFAFQHYLTPSCQEQLKADMQERSDTGELSTRTRSLSELPGQTFDESRVVPEGEDAWMVKLDLELRETLGAMPVKTALIRYPLRVVRYDVDPQKNPFGLALDCFGTRRPERLVLSENGKGAVPAATADQAAAAARPTPATLPAPAGQ